MIFIWDNSHPLLAWGDLQYLVCGQILQLKVSKMSKGKRLRKWEQVSVTMQNDKNTKGYSFRRWLWECKMREISMVVLVDGQSVTSVQSGRPPAWLPLARLFLYMMLCFSWSSWSLWWWRWWWWWQSHVKKRKFSQKRWKGATWIYPIYLSFNHKMFAITYCIRNAWLFNQTELAFSLKKNFCSIPENEFLKYFLFARHPHIKQSKVKLCIHCGLIEFVVHQKVTLFKTLQCQCRQQKSQNGLTCKAWNLTYLVKV